MLRNYLKLAVRNLSRQRVFSIINIAGLAIGLASSLIIMLWVRDELSFDRFHTKADRTYRLLAAASNLEVAITPAPVAPTLTGVITQIEATTRVWPGTVMLQNGELKFEERNVYYTEPSFFDVFDFQLVSGDPITALSQPNGIVLSESTALKYFGTTDVLGRTLRKDNTSDFVVTGVLAPAVGNSHLRFDLLLPWAHAAEFDPNIRDSNWGNFDFFTYVVFDQAPSSDFLHDAESRIDSFYKTKDRDVQVEFKLQPVTDIHLTSGLMGDVKGNGNRQYVTVLGIIAVFIVLIGCINFMNLSTARSARRAKEVGLRKVAGAVRGQLVRQFLSESILISIASLLVAFLLVILALPYVNNLAGKQLVLDFMDPLAMGTIVGIAVVTGLLSGIYPALVLSGFSPIKVFRKDAKSGAGGTVFRNALVVTQFSISIVLIIGTAVVYNQLQFIRSKDLGFDKSNLVYTRIQGNVWGKLGTWRSAFEANPLTAQVTIASGLPTNHSSGTADVTWQGKDATQQVMFAMMMIDENFVPTYNMQIAAGRNFYRDLKGDSNNYMVNQKAAKVMGFTEETAIGQDLRIWGVNGRIVGVVKDFNFKPLQEEIEPLVLSINKWGPIVVVKAEPGKTQETIAAMEAVWTQLEPVYPFSYNFVDQDLENLYQTDRQVGTLFTVFAALAIFISCLGLYGLSAYIAEQRTREIGIRKALGASVGQIIYLLNTRFIIPVVIALAIAAPLAWYGMNRWLEGFAYKVSFNWLLVVVAGALALTVSLLTVSYESIKAARTNPVKSLRSGD